MVEIVWILNAKIKWNAQTTTQNHTLIHFDFDNNGSPNLIEAEKSIRYKMGKISNIQKNTEIKLIECQQATNNIDSKIFQFEFLEIK